MPLGHRLFLHVSSIHGRTHTILTPPVVGPLVVGTTVAWVNIARWGRLEDVPGPKAAGRRTPP
ncbi:hypothetical protein F750_6617 [Streptomyces sp. PAMC 26508]|nr:hypothetical protein F750_6617 [Streptomyces sp. PAMC 26508]